MPPEAAAASATLKLLDESSPDYRSILVTLAVPESLTDSVAETLLNAAASLPVAPKVVLKALRQTNLFVPRNSEWHMHSGARDVLLPLAINDDKISHPAHRILYDIAKSTSISHDIEVPAYLSTPAGVAYHGVALRIDRSAELYSAAALAEHPGIRWLGAQLSNEQQAYGLLPAEAIEPAFSRGMAAYLGGSYSEAEKEFRFISSSSETRIEVAISAHLLGVMLARRRDMSCDVLLERSVELGRFLGARAHTAQALHSKGRFSMTLSRHEAEQALREGLAIAKDIDDLRTESQILHSLALNIRELNPAEAIANLQRSLQIDEELGLVQGQVIVLNSLATLLDETYRSAVVKTIQRAISVSLSANDPQLAAQSYIRLGDFNRRQSQWVPARRAYESALHFASTPDTRADAHLGLSMVAEHHRHDLKGALAEVEAALSLIHSSQKRRVRFTNERANRLRSLLGLS